MKGAPSEFWYVVRGDEGDDLEFLIDLAVVAHGGRWGPLGAAHLFTDERLAVAVAGRMRGARVASVD